MSNHNLADLAINWLTVYYNVPKLCPKRFLSLVPNSECDQPVKSVYMDTNRGWMNSEIKL